MRTRKDALALLSSDNGEIDALRSKWLYSSSEMTAVCGNYNMFASGAAKLKEATCSSNFFFVIILAVHY